MKRNSVGTLSVVFLSLVGAAALHAQSIEEANVPFTFQVGAAQLPAGHYIIKEDHVRESIKIRNVDTGALAVVSVHQSSADAANRALVFHNVGNQHFLSEICGGGDSLNLTLPVSNLEKQAHALQIASMHSQDIQRELVALK
jgi:hypothetical protein